jgi:hypothetical protein
LSLQPLEENKSEFTEEDFNKIRKAVGSLYDVLGEKSKVFIAETRFVDTISPDNPKKNENQKLCNIITILSEKPLITKEDFDKIDNQLYDIYSDINFRHSYSLIEKTVLSISSAEKSTTLNENIEKFQGFVMMYSEKSDGEYIKRVNKFYDHITLGLYRAKHTYELIENFVNSAGKEIQGISKKADIIEESIKKATKELKENETKFDDKISMSEKKTVSNYVTILGIFASIMVVFFGGINIFVGMFSEYDPNYFYSYIVFGSLLGLIFFNSAFALMAIIAHISGNGIIEKDSKGKNIKKVFLFVNIALVGVAIASMVAIGLNQDV